MSNGQPASTGRLEALLKGNSGWSCFRPVQAAPAGFSTPLFIDSGPQFGYSEDLARCCAWGLCVLTRTRLVESLAVHVNWDRLEQATGGWERAIQTPLADPGPLRGRLPQSSPEQICLAVGGNSARALDCAGKSALRWFFEFEMGF